MYSGLIFIIGLVVGSFLNVVIARTYSGTTLLGRSQCAKCKGLIHWYDNIPLISFLLLRGRCRTCHQPISWQYPLVELITALAFVVLYYRFSLTTIFVVGALYSCLLIIIFVQDARHLVILDLITIPGIIIALALNWWLGHSWLELLIGVVVGGGFFLLQYLLSSGRWIGDGDIRLGALMGAMLGFPVVAVAIFLSYIIGAVVSVGLLVSGKKKWTSHVPLGAFITIGTFVSLLWGHELVTWYGQLLGY